MAATADARSQMSETDRPALGQTTGAVRRAHHGDEPAGIHARRVPARRGRGTRAVVVSGSGIARQSAQ